MSLEVVMKKTVFIVIVMLLPAGWAQAEVSIVMNSSFEQNGLINDITGESPRYWCDVNIPAGKFGGLVDTYWSTHGDYSLTIFAEQDVATNASDMAIVSQQTYLTDVNEIIFDLRLSSASIFFPWDPNKRSAIVQIDDTIVWDSNDYQPDGQNQYIDQRIDINDMNGVHDANLHTLSLGIRTNVDNTPELRYYAHWDFVKFDTHCGGFGYLPADFDYSCYVDENDLEMLTDRWLIDGPNYPFDLFADDQNNLNFRDYAVFAYDWLLNTDWQRRDDDNCFEIELLSADLDNDGVVDLYDFALLGQNWTSQADCIEADIDCSRIVDYNDISEMSGQWLEKSWLYNLQ